MPVSVTTNLALTLEAQIANLVGLAQVNGVVSKAQRILLTSGAGVGQADRLYSATLTLAASASQDLDLSGVLADIFGTLILFARIKAIIVIPDPTNVNNVVVGGAASAQFVGPFGAAAHTVSVRPDGLLVMACKDVIGWPVTATTADLLKVANGGAGTPVTFDLVIIGASA